jgi:hypothetical protein
MRETFSAVALEEECTHCGLEGKRQGESHCVHEVVGARRPILHRLESASLARWYVQPRVKAVLLRIVAHIQTAGIVAPTIV